MSDELLVREIRSHNQELFSEIVKRYQNKIMNYIFRLVGSREEAEDLSQDVFIKAYQNLQGFDIKRRFSPWIYRIAHNEAVNFLKKKTRFKILSLDQNQFLENSMVQAENLIEKIIKKENAQNIKKLLDKIPFSYREVLVLRFFEEKSYEEISEILRKPVSTIGTMINRAKAALGKEAKKELSISSL